MKLSTKGRYGLRAMVDLAVYSEKESVFQSEIYCGLWKESLERWTVRD